MISTDSISQDNDTISGLDTRSLQSMDLQLRTTEANFAVGGNAGTQYEACVFMYYDCTLVIDRNLRIKIEK